MSKIQKGHWAVSALTITLSALIAGPLQAQSCTITNGGTVKNISQVYSNKHQCGTCIDNQTKNICQKINKLLVVDYTKASDLITIPHRGLWGPLGPSSNPSENTQAALDKAFAEGYDYIEVDAALTVDDQVFLGHYFSMQSVGGKSSESPSDLTMSQLQQYNMRKRDQSLSIESADRLASMNDVIDWAKLNDVVLMIDPKIPDPTRVIDEDMYIIARVLDYAEQRNALSNIVIKTTRNYNEMTSYLSGELGIDRWNSYIDGNFLWSPIPNKGSKNTISDVVNYLNEWMPVKEQIATVEVGLYSPNHWASKCFTVGSGTVSYANLIEYVRMTTDRRSALWSVDAMGDKGTFGRLYNWKFVGNIADDPARDPSHPDWKSGDFRSNPIATLSYWLSMYTVINTDRPDWFKNMTDPIGQPGQLPPVEPSCT